MDNQFPANYLSPEQLRQMQSNLAALASAQGLQGLGTLNPALYNLITPFLNTQQQQHHQQPQLPDHQQQRQQQQQQLLHQQFTQRLQQQLQQIVSQSQRQHQRPQEQPHSSHNSLNSEPGPVSIRPGQSLVNSIPGEQRRKRGRPPLSGPSTSSGGRGGPTPQGFGQNFLRAYEAIKNQQDQQRDRVQREAKIQQDRKREMRQQQERERQRELRLAQERAERQQEAILHKERERQKAELERQRKIHYRLACQDIDRERRRQHSLIIRNLDAYKRNEEREKALSAVAAERNKQLERRMYQKRLETELGKEIRKPIDDMMLKNHKPLATLNRIPGLKLPGKAFSDLLMSYEFLCNFGETIGLEIKDIPDINTLQLGLLNLTTWAEDQLINILHHLCMFAIKDPKFPYIGSVKEIETIERTNEGLSQLLHFYLQVIVLNGKTELEHEHRLFKLIEERYYVSLNATQKAEMLAFICNELLCSQTVTKQMEDTIENVAKLRKDRWVLENEIRKYRVIKTKREQKEEAEQKAKEALANSITDSEQPDIKGTDDNKSTSQSDSKESIKGSINNNTNKKDVDEPNRTVTRSSLTNGSSATDNNNTQNDRENDTSIQPQINNSDLDDMEPGMTNDELNKKLDNLTRQYNKTSNKLERCINSMRANPLGQDRYRRRYWVLPQVGGVFVEGIESSEPEELENNKFTEEELEEYEKEMEAMLEQARLAEQADNGEEDEVENKIKTEVKDEDDDVLEGKEVDDVVKDEDEPMDSKDEDLEANDTKDESKVEPVENGETENVDKSSADICEPVEPIQSWFSILPRKPCNFSFKQPDIVEDAEPVNMDCENNQKSIQKNNIVDENCNGTEQKADLTDEELFEMRYDLCPVLAKKLDEIQSEQYETPRKIHPQFQHGWWRITDAQQLKSILAVLHERGAREKNLHKHLTKYFQYACNSCKNSTVDFEITSYDRQLAGKNYGAPLPHTDYDSADDLKDGEEEEEEDGEADEIDEETGDDKVPQQPVVVPAKKSKRKKGSGSARSRRLRARAAARRKVENLRNKVAQKQ